MRYLTAWFGGEIPERHLRCLQITKDYLSSLGIVLDVHHFPEITGEPRELTIKKDYYVMLQASKYPDIAVIDCDVEINSIPVMEPGKPYFEFTRCPHIGYFIVNGCCDYFKQKLDAMGSLRQKWGITNGLFSANEVNRIPKESFKHYKFMTENRIL
jgi:hypothetical protein